MDSPVCERHGASRQFLNKNVSFRNRWLAPFRSCAINSQPRGVATKLRVQRAIIVSDLKVSFIRSPEVSLYLAYLSSGIVVFAAHFLDDDDCCALPLAVRLERSARLREKTAQRQTIRPVPELPFRCSEAREELRPPQPKVLATFANED